MPRVFIVDDDRTHLQALEALVRNEGFDVQTAESLAAAKGVLGEAGFDLVLCDLKLPDGSALDLLPLLDEQPDGELVVVTGYGSVDSAVDAFRGGAVDYLTKPIDIAQLRRILNQIRRTARLRHQLDDLRGRLREFGSFGPMIGASLPMQEVYDQISRVAPTDATVLITGETGTGKELVAQAIHELSRRSQGPFVPVNCGAIPSTLIESELFGHERGSFSGATKRHQGFFERADGGTLFLDEITEMPIELQVKLLRTLESRELRRVGGEEEIGVDVRVVAATNRDPEKEVADGRLREDLLYRLLVFPIRIPPLRERGEDVALLATHFLADLNRPEKGPKQLKPEALERLRLHDWPGNVRELKHVVERGFILASGAEIGPECFPLASQATTRTAADAGDLGIRVGMSTAEAERILTLATLEHTGEKKRAAEMLGISLKTLYNRLKSYQGGGAAGSSRD